MCILIKCIVINSDSEQQKVTLSPLSLLISARMRSKHGRRCRNWGKRWRAGIKPQRFALYLITSMHLEPRNKCGYFKPRRGWKETSSHSSLLFDLVWDLLRSKCLQAFVALDNTYGGVKYEAVHVDKWNAKTAAIDRKGHVYWMRTLTTNTRRSTALVTLHQCVKVQMDFMVNDDHPLL